MPLKQIKIRRLGTNFPYQTAYQAMQQFTAVRNSATTDEIWLLQHPPTYTQGINGHPEHLFSQNKIPLIKIDRGGQITYHGPGQWVIYLLLDLRRLKMGIRELVSHLEQGVITLLQEFGVDSSARQDAPGVYVDGAKIAALGLKIKHGYCYHGLSLNVAMDLSPFQGINPCGYQGMQVTDTRSLGINSDQDKLAERLIELLSRELGYQKIVESDNQLPLAKIQ